MASSAIQHALLRSNAARVVVVTVPKLCTFGVRPRLRAPHAQPVGAAEPSHDQAASTGKPPVKGRRRDAAAATEPLAASQRSSKPWNSRLSALAGTPAAQRSTGRARNYTSSSSAATADSRQEDKAQEGAAGARVTLPEPAAVAASRSQNSDSFDGEEEQQWQQQQQAAASPLGSVSDDYLSDVEFDSLPINTSIKRSIASAFGYQRCTQVQAQTVEVILSGVDVLAKAKTGSGKTLAFLIPAIENLMTAPQPKGQVGVLVLSPTRELALQIYTEAQKLLSCHKGLSVQAAIGGTSVSAQISRLKASVPDILVATPGRCLDLLENGGLGPKMRSLKVLVLDEADNVLDMGFRPTLDKILAALPDRCTRQNLLFSATFPEDVKKLAKFAFCADGKHQVVDTVGEETTTNVLVEQFQCVVPHTKLLLQLAAVLQDHMAKEPDHKVMVFLPTARLTQLYAEVFQKMQIGNVLEIHSRKSQGYRTRVSDEFRTGSRVCLFSSDVSARGVDYAGVTLVVQVGLPSAPDQYVHRVGRTARGGKAGTAMLLLADFEARGFLAELNKLELPIVEVQPEAEYEKYEARMAEALAKVSKDTKAAAYVAWLGFYNSAPTVKLTKEKLVDVANTFSRIIGCAQPPEIEARTIGKMGLKGVTNLRVRVPVQKSSRPPRSGERDEQRQQQEPRGQEKERRVQSSRPPRTGDWAEQRPQRPAQRGSGQGQERPVRSGWGEVREQSDGQQDRRSGGWGEQERPQRTRLQRGTW